jgi:integrase/recombinase XerD
MNHRSSGSLVLTKAITGFINYKTAEGLTFRSVDSYRRALEQWAEHIGEIDTGCITHQSISDYLLYLRTEYVPRRFSGDTRALSGKTLRNVYVTLASFFAWATSG